jgi:hypothetical protein
MPRLVLSIIAALILAGGCGGVAAPLASPSPSPILVTKSFAAANFSIGVPTSYQVAESSSLSSELSSLQKKHPKWSRYGASMSDLSNPSSRVQMIAIDPNSADTDSPAYYFVSEFTVELAVGETFNLKTGADAFFRALFQGDTLAQSTLVRSTAQVSTGTAEIATADSMFGTRDSYTGTVYLVDHKTISSVHVYALAFIVLKGKTDPWRARVASSFQITA